MLVEFAGSSTWKTCWAGVDLVTGKGLRRELRPYVEKELVVVT